MLQKNNIVDGALYRYNRETWEYEADSHTFVSLKNKKNRLPVDSNILIEAKEVNLTKEYLTNEGFTKTEDESAYGQHEIYKHKNHPWFCIDVNSNSKMNVTVNGGMVLSQIKTTSELKSWKYSLGIM